MPAQYLPKLILTVLLHLTKRSTLPWTVYSNECLDILEKENEFESDALLVQLVELRRISEDKRPTLVEPGYWRRRYYSTYLILPEIT